MTARGVAIPLAVGMFCAGLAVILVIFGLSAAGYRDLPWWLNAGAMLCPLGLGVALVALVVRSARKSLTRN
ncbi:hypothetical protein CDG81_02710 [Actinopolyspora erythraea]|uniref:Uncharacterized protein n=1 Tax=Actinopolyspora erythraea TaxID=414996 RepID=A0A099D2H4_9ACTN|nr:hypothetical protein [Actinopolyspora erythraea]ASU77392.1 hypothetical protein CDG81_02710 [Actinopolyspora erythraea]KGI80393.1 hypothetical protein IL38_18270 [Actinopolyspora erythraea]